MSRKVIGWFAAGAGIMMLGGIVGAVGAALRARPPMPTTTVGADPAPARTEKEPVLVS